MDGHPLIKSHEKIFNIPYDDGISVGNRMSDSHGQMTCRSTFSVAEIGDGFWTRAIQETD
jgi:hypothetical protein